MYLGLDTFTADRDILPEPERASDAGIPVVNLNLTNLKESLSASPTPNDNENHWSKDAYMSGTAFEDASEVDTKTKRYTCIEQTRMNFCFRRSARFVDRTLPLIEQTDVFLA